MQIEGPITEQNSNIQTNPPESLTKLFKLTLGMVQSHDVVYRVPNVGAQCRCFGAADFQSPMRQRYVVVNLRHGGVEGRWWVHNLSTLQVVGPTRFSLVCTCAEQNLQMPWATLVTGFI